MAQKVGRVGSVRGVGSPFTAGCSFPGPRDVGKHRKGNALRVTVPPDGGFYLGAHCFEKSRLGRRFELGERWYRRRADHRQCPTGPDGYKPQPAWLDSRPGQRPAPAGLPAAPPDARQSRFRTPRQARAPRRQRPIPKQDPGPRNEHRRDKILFIGRGDTRRLRLAHRAPPHLTQQSPHTRDQECLPNAGHELRREAPPARRSCQAAGRERGCSGLFPRDGMSIGTISWYSRYVCPKSARRSRSSSLVPRTIHPVQSTLKRSWSVDKRGADHMNTSIKK